MWASEQIQRYLAHLDNLILTNYLEFQLFLGGELFKKIKLGTLNSQGAVEPTALGNHDFHDFFETFSIHRKKRLYSSSELAEALAKKSKLLRHAIEKKYENEAEHGALHALHHNYHEFLLTQMTKEDFHDMQAQTISYGLFAARLRHNRGEFTAHSAIKSLSSPFLKEVFSKIIIADHGMSIEWVINEIVEVLSQSNMPKIMRDINAENASEDPIIHFYENYLEHYDSDLKKKKGVFYTPKPVVDYIVRSVDKILINQYSISEGLANSDVINLNGNAEEEMHPRVIIFDPASGTGAFLNSAIQLIRRRMQKMGKIGIWSDYVISHLLPRLIGFEILMAPYAICHLTIEQELSDALSNLKEEEYEIKVYLANTLDQVVESNLSDHAGPIIKESIGANKVKTEDPVMVIIGNPPYSGHSINNSQWIRDLLRGKSDTGDSENYFFLNGKKLDEQNMKWLNDDYVKFIRAAQHKIEKTGEGVIGFVTNHKYISAPTFRGMRESLLKSFDEIYVLNLHGDQTEAKKNPTQNPDENIFNIKQGVSISFFIKHRESKQKHARVFYKDFWGPREEKFAELVGSDIYSTEWLELQPKYPYYKFFPAVNPREKEYSEYIPIHEVFDSYSSGIVTARNDLTIHLTKDQVMQTVTDFESLAVEAAREKYNLGNDAQDWKVHLAQEDLRESFLDGKPDESLIKPLLVFPFDRKFTYYTEKSRGFMCRPRAKIMKNMLSTKNLGLICPRQVITGKAWNHSFVCDTIIESSILLNTSTIFPLLIFKKSSLATDNGKIEMKPVSNISRGFIKLFKEKTGIQIKLEGDCMHHEISPKDLLKYIYAMMNSGNYRSMYNEFLLYDFPRIPFTSNSDLFHALIKLGGILVEASLLNISKFKDYMHVELSRAGSNIIGTVGCKVVDDGNHVDVYINRDKKIPNIRRDIWNFEIGSNKPLEIWLKTRKGHALSFTDLQHWEKAYNSIRVIMETSKRIDDEINRHGGWPIK